MCYFCWPFQSEELRQRLRELEERERREGKKMADEEALRKIRSVEEQIDILNKKLSIAKQVCEQLIVTWMYSTDGMCFPGVSDFFHVYLFIVIGYINKCRSYYT